MDTIILLTSFSKDLIRKLLIVNTVLFLIFICVPSAETFAQNDTVPVSSYTIRDKIFTGGNIGLSFGTLTYIDISPLLGYKITPKFSAGLGVTYIYYKDNIVPNNNSSSIYGGRTFARYLVLENVFAYSEYEVLNREIYDDVRRKERRVNVGSFFVGAGYQQRIGGNSFMNLMVLWNLNENPYSLYRNPIIRGGVNIGF